MKVSCLCKWQPLFSQCRISEAALLSKDDCAFDHVSSSTFAVFLLFVFMVMLFILLSGSQLVLSWRIVVYFSLCTFYTLATSWNLGTYETYLRCREVLSICLKWEFSVLEVLSEWEASCITHCAERQIVRLQSEHEIVLYWLVQRQT